MENGQLKELGRRDPSSQPGNFCPPNRARPTWSNPACRADSSRRNPEGEDGSLGEGGSNQVQASQTMFNPVKHVMFYHKTFRLSTLAFSLQDLAFLSVKPSQGKSSFAGADNWVFVYFAWFAVQVRISSCESCACCLRPRHSPLVRPSRTQSKQVKPVSRPFPRISSCKSCLSCLHLSPPGIPACRPAGRFYNAPMLDIKLIREKPDFVRQRLAARGGHDEARIDQLLDLDEQRRKVLVEVEQLKANRNRVSKEIGALMGQKKTAEAEAKKTETKDLGERIATLDQEAAQAEAARNALMLQLPNLPHESVPPG